MKRLEVVAGESILAGYTRTPFVGICELVWNAFDEDAENVDVWSEDNVFGSIDKIHVDDDGSGMTEASALRAFQSLGDSWKFPLNSLSDVKKRAVHGRNGRGRYAAFSLGSLVTWKSTAMDGTATKEIRVSGSSSDLKHFDVSDAVDSAADAGTQIEIVNVTDEAQRLFDNDENVRTKLLTTFALHLEQYKDFELRFKHTVIDPAKKQLNREELVVPTPDGLSGAIQMVIIDWDLKNVDRRIYLCDDAGTVLHDIPARVQAPGAEFSVYLRWQGFKDAQHNILLAEDSETAAGQVIQAAKMQLKEHLAERMLVRERQIVAQWQGENVYPYSGEPENAVERLQRQAFNVVALTAARTVDANKSPIHKKLELRLIREALENRPSSLHAVLRDVLALPEERVEELKDLLERTTLSGVISASKDIADRMDFLKGLDTIVFDKEPRKHLLERTQLHRILANETWVFGEEWALTGDDERLIEVLKKYLAKLDVDVALAGVDDIRREDGRIAIPDLVLSRKLTTSENRYSNLVIELKRPNHKLMPEDVEQLRSYAQAVTSDERFMQPNAYWDFVLIGNSTSDGVDELREQINLPYGVVYQTKRYKLSVKNWSEIIGDAEHRLKFVRESLDYTATRDDGIRYLQEKHAEYLPGILAADSVTASAPAKKEA